MEKITRRKIIKSAIVGSTTIAIAAPAVANNNFKWKMVTCWPKNFPGLGTSANRLAKRITEASGGKLNIKVYGAGEIVPAYEVFDAVRNGVAEMSHDSPYYWLSKHPATAFFSTVPAGLSSAEQTTWLLDGGGQELWDELYSNFGLIGFPAGNAGLQMLGWYKNKISSLKGNEKAVSNEKQFLREKIDTLKKETAQYENNMSFLGINKGTEPLRKQVEKSLN